MLMTAKNRALYHEAICCAIPTLMRRATSRGSAWYHYNEDGEMVVGTRLTLTGGGS